MAVTVTDEHPVGLEDLYSETSFELAQQAEHPVDRATRGLGAFVDGDDEETALDDRPRRGDRHVVRGPGVEERIDGRERVVALRLVERGGDAEDPDTGFVGELVDVGAGHVLVVYPEIIVVLRV